MVSEQYDLTKLQIRREEPGDPPSGRRNRFLIAAGAIVVILVAAAFVLRSALSPDEEVETATVTLVSPAEAGAVLTASGYVVAQRKAAVASKATGRIVELNYKEGDPVRKGDIIARIESADVDAALAQAKADLAVAAADRDDARRTLERTEQLFGRSLVSQAELDAARSRFDRVVATIASKSAAVQAAAVQVENTRIRAPFSGTILTKNADVGEVVAPFAAGASSRVAVVTVADMSSLQVEADVAESNIERISANQPCEITLNAYPSSRYAGAVDKIVPTADRAKATVLTKVRFLSIDDRVLPEMEAKVHFLPAGAAARAAEQSPPRLAVDASAVTTRDGKSVAFVLHETTVSAVPVTPGARMGSLVEIRSGLNEGEKVVLHPPERLRDGARVKIKQ